MPFPYILFSLQAITIVGQTFFFGSNAFRILMWFLVCDAHFYEITTANRISESLLSTGMRTCANSRETAEEKNVHTHA